MKIAQRRKASVEVRKLLFTAIIPIVFGNEVSSTPKLISSLERTTCSSLFEISII